MVKGQEPKYITTDGLIIATQIVDELYGNDIEVNGTIVIPINNSDLFSMMKMLLFLLSHQLLIFIIIILIYHIQILLVLH